MSTVLEAGQFEQLVREVTQQIQSNSQGVGELNEVTSLSGINSLPTLRNGDEVVVVPISLLEKPAVDAAARADAAANEALQKANNAVTEAQTAINQAVSNANDTAEHPTKVGEDNYVYIWDKENKAYNKTSIYVRGEGFKISKVYASVEEMNADTAHGLKEGDFALINTNDVENPENAQIYVVDKDGTYQFLVDMSGAIGFTGKTPQIEVGVISTGANRQDSGATITENGKDEEGNPKYLLNIKIPTLTIQDLTSEEIAQLQEPSRKMIEQLEATDIAVKTSEETRVNAESARRVAESDRQSAENERKSAESARKEAESARVSAENIRKSNETARINNDTTREGNEQARILAENTRVASENARNQAEQGRKDAESARVETERTRANSESTRQANEQNRQSAESVRANAESIRISKEDTRNASEATRESNEATRKTNETARVNAESERTTEYATLKADILAATKNANDAASESRNTPIIQNGNWWIWSVEQDKYVDSGTLATGKSPQIVNGTWWTWDEAKGELVDTGQSVSAEYQLTKEKVEGVLTGNVSSHTHDVYVTKVDGKGLSEADFTNAEKEKLAFLENYDDTELRNALGAIKIPTKVSELQNDQKYVTESEMTSKGYASNTDLEEGLSAKQDKNLYFTEVAASVWVEDTTYADFSYRCDIPCTGVTGNMYAEVVFGLEESTSGEYAPVCETKKDVVSIWSAKNQAIIIPTILITK